MDLNFDIHVEPFFQVFVVKIENELTSQTFFAKFKQTLALRNNHSSSHLFVIKQPKLKEIAEDYFFACCIKHDSVPTWYKPENKIDLSVPHKDILLDTEYDLLVFYRKDDYVFIHTNCPQVFSLIEKTMENLFEDNSIKYKKLAGAQINLILNQFEIEYRSLGIQNHFGMGGTAPDAKTYFSKDASNSLTPSFDAGYGFSYCIGSRKINDTQKAPFGCSKTKSKIWTTWIKDLDQFCDQCDAIVSWLGSPPSTNAKLDVLVQSVNADIINTVSPIEFFLDYYIPEKGLVFLGDGNGLTLDWTCKYEPDKTIIIFDTIVDDVITTTELKFVFDKTTETYTFSYAAGQTLHIVITEQENAAEEKRKVDLVEFLNKQHNFTILYNEPYAYRDEECWEDNRLKRPFSHTSDFIDWSGVDIKKESSKASAGKLNILEKIEKHFTKDADAVFCCNDNGANEIADYLVLYENKIILIHAKYASDNKPKVSIGDIQIVASQTVKNVRFFQIAGYSDSIVQRLFTRASKNTFKNIPAFKTKLTELLQSKDTERECWIVQPGISISKLKADTNNKMHTILNFVDSILRVNNIAFKLVASKN